MYTVYIIYSPSLDRYYIGFTQDITDRLRRHNSKSKGFTSRANDWSIVHIETFSQKIDAMKREKEIKGSKSKKPIETLICTPAPHDALPIWKGVIVPIQ